MSLKIIRAFKYDAAIYMEMFYTNIGKFIKVPFPEENVGLDYTKGLTYKRQWLYDNGYKEAVKKTDEDFIKKYRTGERKERFEKFWLGHAERHKDLNLLERYKDSL